MLKVRREKLADLQANGKDPFKIVKYDVTHHSQEIKDHFDELEVQMGISVFCRMEPMKLVVRGLQIPGMMYKNGWRVSSWKILIQQSGWNAYCIRNDLKNF